MREQSSPERRASRRQFIRTGVLLAGGLALPGLPVRAGAEDRPPVGTYPAGVQGSTVTIGIAVPRTGTYAEQGADELKGWQLAVEHINSGHPLIREISPKTKKGVLGKELKVVVADSAAKPNDAVQAQQRFITEHKVILMTGSTSSAVAVAMNTLAQRDEGALRHRHLRRALRLPPELLRRDGGERDRAGAAEGLRQEQEGRVHDGVNWGHDAVLSVQQAKQFGIIPKMKLVIPYQIPFEGLAPLIVRELVNVCRRLAAEGHTLVVVEQNLAATMALAQRVYILNNGHLAHEGPADDLRARPEILHRYLGV